MVGYVNDNFTFTHSKAQQQV